MHMIHTPRIYVLVVVLLVLLLPILVTNITAADVSPFLPSASSSSSFITEKKDTNPQHSSTDGTENKIISLPLIHRDQVITRRRRELRAQNKNTRLVQQEQKNNKITASEGREPETDNSSSSTQEEYFADSEQDTNESDYEEIENGGLVEDGNFPPVIGQLFQGFGTHFVDLWVGTPTPQRQTLIVDTGSGVVAFPCEPACRDCGYSYHTDGADFRNQDSTTYILEQCGNCHLGTCEKVDDFEYCGMSMGYAEGSSWHAYESRDYAYVGGSHSEPEILDADHDATRRYTRGNIERRDFGRGRKRNLRQLGEGSASITNSTLSEIEIRAASLRKTYQQDATAKDFSFELNFGCQYKITGLFKTQLADGIMVRSAGIAPNVISARYSLSIGHHFVHPFIRPFTFVYCYHPGNEKFSQFILAANARSRHDRI
jgi:hypothetical protein